MKELWVFHEPGNSAGDELLIKGRELADRAGMKLCRVSVDLDEFQNDRFAEAVARLVKERRPEIFLFGATAVGKTLAPSLAARLGTGLTADCTRLEIDRETGLLKMIRPAYGGSVLATVLCGKHRPQMATVRPGCAVGPGHGRDVPAAIEYEEIRIQPRLSGSRNRMEKLQSSVNAEQSRLHGAEYIVAGGRGMGAPENFKLLKELADVLGGAVGASKAVVDIGWKQVELQIGLSGKSVAPAVYIACGISGAVQHWEGIKNADIIVAVNSDPDAPIFDYADYGLVGDLHEIVPELTRQLKARNEIDSG